MRPARALKPTASEGGWSPRGGAGEQSWPYVPGSWKGEGQVVGSARSLGVLLPSVPDFLRGCLKVRGSKRNPLSPVGLLLYLFFPLLFKAGRWLSQVRTNLIRNRTELSVETNLYRRWPWGGGGVEGVGSQASSLSEGQAQPQSSWLGESHDQPQAPHPAPGSLLSAPPP